MDSRTQERVEEWDSRSFSGGFDGLSDLADGGFSGAVAAGGSWLCLLNGRIVGVLGGEITDFEDATGTVYQAPHPSLPLLCTMEAHGGDVQAKYYTNETPLREVDETLQNGSFTGYIELSENVLSGDYYAVYYGGRRMAAAYIGNAERLITGDEAFERADDEVGIYEVIDVEIEVTDVPGTEAPAVETGTETATDDGETTEGRTATSQHADVSDPTADDYGPVDDTTTAEPTADPTESAIDPIDVSGTEPAVSGNGITDGEDSTLTAPDSGESDGITTPVDGASATDADSPTDSPQAQSGAPDGSPAQSGITANPDPETVEAAAEELDQNDISWLEDDGDEGGDADDSETAEPPASPDPETANSARTRSQEQTQEQSNGRRQHQNQPQPQDRNRDRDRDRNSPSSRSQEPPQSPHRSADPDDPADPVDPDADDPDAAELDQQFEAEEQWRETRSIPSIDPDNSAAAGGDADSDSTGSAQSASAVTAPTRPTNAQQDPPAGDRKTRETDAETGSSSSSSVQGSHSTEGTRRSNSSDTTSTDPTPADDRHKRQLTQYTRRIEELESKHDALANKARELKSERDELRAENQELAATIEQLRGRVSELETELEQARSGSGTGSGSRGAVDAETHLSPAQALSGTNLFVRYASKSQPTLETAHDGGADRSEVATNLRLEHHTEFDAASVAVEDQPYEAFLTETIEHRFVDWLTERVLYEIRDTGHADGLADLYDAIPRIDRAELGATISLSDDDTDDVPDQVTFDVVAFDKMGNPLVLATFNDSREPASQELLEELEEAASAVKANYPDLAAAVAVTSSYFEPGALEVAEQATSSGFLSRGSKLSYVNLSRKSGYHLCLVESRSEGFHMNVPEL
ncbi:DUF7527 domain-containing protein [Natrialba asiatica]|uniref:DUF7527 domain-containing protein n=1 Tax=Natrialba asiatica (strain ATCC 700177 / DSM 12278 / JCM 9576 / FERM P-10747 / NBRC 102637 / 172P1) TaxID=29540 RepID=M0ANX4_NATA1|nr:hypothetical protein [Natrialba asiatica]ELZ00431.1 hypothetical protein C481_12314 [Natrialba asiatica DSM 12278]